MNEQILLNIKEEVTKVIRELCEEDRLKFANFNHYEILDKIIELMDTMPKYIPSLIQSYEKILELIVRLKEDEKQCQN